MNVEKMIKRDISVEIANYLTNNLTCYEKKILMMKIWNAVLIFGTACLVWTALYLDFTPVGSMVINGVSPRYYLPLIFPLSLIFINQKVRCSMKLENYQSLIAFLMLIGTGISIYCLMLA